MRVLVTERSVGCGCVSGEAPVAGDPCPGGAESDAHVPSDELVTWEPVSLPKQSTHLHAARLLAHAERTGAVIPTSARRQEEEQTAWYTRLVARATTAPNLMARLLCRHSASRRVRLRCEVSTTQHALAPVSPRLRLLRHRDGPMQAVAHCVAEEQQGVSGCTDSAWVSFAAVVAAATLATLDLPPCGNSPAAASGVAMPRSTLDGGAALGEAALPFDWSAAPHAPTFLITGAPRGAASSPQGWARGWRGDHLLLGGSAQPHDMCPSPGTLAAALQGPGEARQTPITRAATETPAASTLQARVAALEAGIQTPHSQQLPASSAEGAAASASRSAAAQARRLRAVARMAIAPRPQPGPLSPTSAAQERAMTRASVLALRMVWSAAALATQPPAASPVLPRRAPKAAASPPAWPPRAACASAGGVSSSEPAVPRSPAVFTRFSPGRLQEEACILSPSPALPDKLYATPARQRSFGTNVTNSRSPSLEGLAALATMR